jgi:hypothetical protein
MYPIWWRKSAMAIAVVAVLAVLSPHAFAHGGGGGGGGHGSGGHGCGGSHGCAIHQSFARTRSGYGTDIVGNGYSRANPADVPWPGFPEDLPEARLRRFLVRQFSRFHFGAWRLGERPRSAT